MSSHLKLFNEIPVNSKFRFETPDAGKVFIKTDEKSAHHDGAFYPVNPGVLVFPVPDQIALVEFRTLAGHEFLAVLHPDNQWGLYTKTDEPVQIFKTLEDVINHLGS